MLGCGDFLRLSFCLPRILGSTLVLRHQLLAAWSFGDGGKDWDWSRVARIHGRRLSFASVVFCGTVSGQARLVVVVDSSVFYFSFRESSGRGWAFRRQAQAHTGLSLGIGYGLYLADCGVAGIHGRRILFTSVVFRVLFEAWRGSG